MQLGLTPTQLQGSNFTTNAPALWQAHQEPDPHSLVMIFTVILEIQAEIPIVKISTLIVFGTILVCHVLRAPLAVTILTSLGSKRS